MPTVLIHKGYRFSSLAEKEMNQLIYTWNRLNDMQNFGFHRFNWQNPMDSGAVKYQS